MCWVAQELIEKGERQGERQGEVRLATLLQRLTADGRSMDVQDAINSEESRKKFYQEYGLTE